jgi:tRNA uridine 5-carboxymethylaminomethyl modification enzyme
VIGSGSYDVVVVGLGHAGTEAALAAARMGCRVAAVSQSLGKAGLMSCNPAVGGPGKSQLVAEIDALGGAMAAAADEAGLQFRILNRSKGPAIHATRAQVDRARYAAAIHRRLRAQPGLELIEGAVVGLATEAGCLVGLRLADGRELACRAAVITTGTFLMARMHVGERSESGGRVGDPAAVGLSESLRACGLTLGRFKTGTPPRLDGRTIDYGACEEQPSEADAGPLSSRTDRATHPSLPQRSCFATHTVPATHAVVAANLRHSPLFTGAIGSRGPRYCPSLEHKISAFAAKDRHAVYLEPDGLDTPVVYPAGLSTSLPAEVQVALLRTIPGLARVEMVQPGYAVEYDYVPATQLDGGMQVININGLFLAGQINGSSGYEEAAGQGLVAGINAALQRQGRPAWHPEREESFLGVLCGDLTTRGFDEPYRVLPARAERLSLRQDNAGLRLWRTAEAFGLTDASQSERIRVIEAEVEALERCLSEADRIWLRRPETQFEQMAERPQWSAASTEARRQLYLRLRYEPYERQRLLAAQRLRALGDWAIPADLRLESVVGLSSEARSALHLRRPSTLAEAGSLPGVTSSALAVLAAHLRRRARAVSPD